MTERKGRSRVGEFREKLAKNPGALFDGVLSEEEINEECLWLGHVWRERIFTPLVTLWTFLNQVLEIGSSCGEAVARVLSYLSVTTGLDASHDPSAYSKARKRLPEQLAPRLTRMVAEKLASKVDAKHLWHGHRVKLVDGSSVAMWDTPENQAAYPQPKGQSPGCGFPVARIVGLFDLTTGALADLAMGPLSEGETRLFRTLWPSLSAGEVVVGDRYYCSYADIALLRSRGVDVVFRLHQNRKVDFREGESLGRDDRRVEWTKETCPKWMSREVFDALPETQTVRLVRFRCRVPGWRVDKITVVTTLLDAKKYSARALGKLYHRRWEVETDLDGLKTTMKMEFLRTRTPEMIRRELWVHLLAYNLVRTLMWDAARRRRVEPLRLSFKGAIHEMVALWPFTPAAARQRDLRKFYDALLRNVGSHRIPDRPGRSEPRVRKRRPKNYPLMTRPRRSNNAPAHKEAP